MTEEVLATHDRPQKISPESIRVDFIGYDIFIM